MAVIETDGGTAYVRDLIAAKLNLFPEVAWDRWGGYHRWQDDDGDPVDSVWLFGWVAREDGRSDFVTLEGWYLDEEIDRDPVWRSTTSSARYSHEFAERLGIAENHADCRRIESDFAGLVDRAVAL